MSELKVSKERIIEAAEKCSTAKNVLETIFPEAFEKPVLFTSADGFEMREDDRVYIVVQEAAKIYNVECQPNKEYKDKWNHTRFKKEENAQKFRKETYYQRFSIIDFQAGCVKFKIGKKKAEEFLNFLKKQNSTHY